jgi:ketopantoate reductase
MKGNEGRTCAMKILVCGSGPLGSLFAARLKQGGHDVTLLARGQRLADLRQHGIVLHDVQADAWTTDHVTLIEQLAPDDPYDLALVIMRKNQALDLLPVLAANPHIPNVLFLMNNAAGPDALVQALGRERVLIGFPSSAGYRDGHVMHVLTGRPGDETEVPIGEIDGRSTDRIRRVAAALERMPGFEVEVQPDMDAWLKYHVALLMPSLAAAFYMCGMNRIRLAGTRDALVLALRAIREGFRVLGALGYPITPSELRVLAWAPEPLLVAIFQRRLRHPLMEVALAKHAGAARDEIQHLADEFLALARLTTVPTPAIQRLYPQLAEDAPLMPAGSAHIPLDWRSVWAGLAVAGGVLAVVALVGHRIRRLPGPDRDAQKGCTPEKR